MGKKKNRNVGIVGIGQTEYSSHKENQNQVEMVNEAVRLALEDANLTLDDIDCVVHGNMELFEMIHQPDMWHALGSGAAGKASFRVTTGGTVGMTVTCAADNLVASGLYDVVLAIGFQKLQECGSTTAGNCTTNREYGSGIYEPEYPVICSRLLSLPIVSLPYFR